MNISYLQSSKTLTTKPNILLMQSIIASTFLVATSYFSTQIESCGQFRPLLS